MPIRSKGGSAGYRRGKKGRSQATQKQKQKQDDEKDRQKQRIDRKVEEAKEIHSRLCPNERRAEAKRLQTHQEMMKKAAEAIEDDEQTLRLQNREEKEEVGLNNRKVYTTGIKEICTSIDSFLGALVCECSKC